MFAGLDFVWIELCLPRVHSGLESRACIEVASLWLETAQSKLCRIVCIAVEWEVLLLLNAATISLHYRTVCGSQREEWLDDEDFRRKIQDADGIHVVVTVLGPDRLSQEISLRSQASDTIHITQRVGRLCWHVRKGSSKRVLELLDEFRLEDFLECLCKPHR